MPVALKNVRCYIATVTFCHTSRVTFFELYFFVIGFYAAATCDRVLHKPFVLSVTDIVAVISVQFLSP